MRSAEKEGHRDREGGEQLRQRPDQLGVGQSARTPLARAEDREAIEATWADDVIGLKRSLFYPTGGDRVSAMIRGVLILLASVVALAAADSTQPKLAIDPALLLTLTGSPGSFHTLLSASKLDGNQGWQVLTNVTLDATGNAMVQLSPPVESGRFYKRFTPEGLVAIPPGTFTMGSPGSERGREPDETQHMVTLTRGFWMGQREVTQGAYLSVIGSNPSYFTNGVHALPGGSGGRVTNDLRHPVEQVSWIDATNYCARLTQHDLTAGLIPVDYAYRLPTEAEWEYACRGGTKSAFGFGNAIRQGMANFDAILEYDSATGSELKRSNVPIYRTIETGSYSPNAFGLCDMHGNVWEWCSDWYGNYPIGEVTDPTGPTSGDFRVYRGGNWGNPGVYCRAANRSGFYSGEGYNYNGFRVVLAPTR